MSVCDCVGGQDDEPDKPFVSRILHRLANYDGGMLPATDHHDDETLSPPVDDGPTAELNDVGGAGGKKKKAKPATKKQKKSTSTVSG